MSAADLQVGYASRACTVYLQKIRSYVCRTKDLQSFDVCTCRQPDLVLVGLGWDGCDERKMRRSFQMGKGDFASFIDVSQIGQELGYERVGLASMSQQVLGLCSQKNKQVGNCPCSFVLATSTATCLPALPCNSYVLCQSVFFGPGDGVAKALLNIVCKLSGPSPVASTSCNLGTTLCLFASIVFVCLIAVLVLARHVQQIAACPEPTHLLSGFLSTTI